MQFSTDLPHGEKGTQQHLASGTKLPMNVSAKADQQFMQELRRTDPKRYARLEKAIRTQAIQASERCEHCNLILPSDIRKDAKYCDTTCQRNHRRESPALEAA